MNRLCLHPLEVEKLKAFEQQQDQHCIAVAAYRTAAYAVMVRPKRTQLFGDPGLVPDNDRAVLAWYGNPDIGDIPAVLRYDNCHRAWVWHSTGAIMKQTVQRWLELPE